MNAERATDAHNRAHHVTPLQQITVQIARVAYIAVVEGHLEVDAALDHVAKIAISDANDARARRGAFATHLTTDQRDAFIEYGQVAADILDGTVSRPSTGNVRDYARANVCSTSNHP